MMERCGTVELETALIIKEPALMIPASSYFFPTMKPGVESLRRNVSDKNEMSDERREGNEWKREALANGDREMQDR